MSAEDPDARGSDLMRLVDPANPGMTQPAPRRYFPLRAFDFSAFFSRSALSRA